jgi:hypothetical protein
VAHTDATNQDLRVTKFLADDPAQAGRSPAGVPPADGPSTGADGETPGTPTLPATGGVRSDLISVALAALILGGVLVALAAPPRPGLSHHRLERPLSGRRVASADR